MTYEFKKRTGSIEIEPFASDKRSINRCFMVWARETPFPFFWFVFRRKNEGCHIHTPQATKCPLKFLPRSLPRTFQFNPNEFLLSRCLSVRISQVSERFLDFHGYYTTSIILFPRIVFFVITTGLYTIDKFEFGLKIFFLFIRWKFVEKSLFYNLW